MTAAHDVFDRLDVLTRPTNGDFHTIAGFALLQLGHLPEVGEAFTYGGWRFEIVGVDGPPHRQDCCDERQHRQ